MSIIGPLIFKRDARGEIRTWQYEVDGGSWRTIAGLINGEKVISGWTTCKPKSQDTVHLQARFEAQAEMKKKLDRDYRETLEEVDRPRDSIIKPMLAHKFDGWVTGWQKVFSQPKLDGIRCIATINGLWSRQGKPIVACPHIEENLRPLFDLNPGLILDGELYNHDLKDDFNKITSVVKKLKPTDEDRAEARQVIQYHIYDVPSSPWSFSERHVLLSELIETEYSSLRLVTTRSHSHSSSLDVSYEHYLEDGYEGQIVRLDGPYEQKRSKLLLKRKEFLDAEYEVLRIEEGQGNWAGFAKRAVLRLPDGREFGAGIKGDQAFTKQLLDGPTPQTATIRYFQLTPDGVPRFPVATAFHEGDRL